MPIIAGVGQVANKDADRIVHPVDLLETAARIALEDAGIAADRIGGVLATPLSVFSEENASLMLAERLGLPAGLRTVSTYSGASPQKLIARACRAILDGTAEAILIAGGIADASVQRAHIRGIEPPAPPTSHWSQGTSASARAIPARVLKGHWMGYVPEIAAGALLPSAYFALTESAFALSRDPADHRAELARLLSPFTAAAAKRPDVAWFPAERTAADIGTPRPDNRLIAEPFTKLMCSFPTVDLAAAIVVAADHRFGSAARPVVRPLGIVSAHQPTSPSGWPTIGHPAALDRAVEELFATTGLALDDIHQFDFYSCFPTAVRLFANAFGLALDDPRPFSAAGGLPYFGGPGASYSLHGIACLVEDLRARPGTIAAAGSLGGMVTDFTVGLYGTVDADCALRDLDVDPSASVPVVETATGPAVIEAATVLHDKAGPSGAPIIARLPDGSRTGGRAGDPELPASLAGGALPIGREVTLSTKDGIVSYALC